MIDRVRFDRPDTFACFGTGCQQKRRTGGGMSCEAGNRGGLIRWAKVKKRVEGNEQVECAGEVKGPHVAKMGIGLGQVALKARKLAGRTVQAGDLEPLGRKVAGDGQAAATANIQG